MDNNSFILCKYNFTNLLETKICSFSMINDVFHYLTNQFYFIHKEEFLKSYLDYLNGKYGKNGHNILIPKNYVFSFQYGNDLYELYAIDKNSKYTLLTFNIYTKLIGCVQCFDSHENALTQMKINYCKIFNEEIINTDDIFNEEIINTNEIQTIPDNGLIYGMIFKCNIDFVK